jgi:cellulose synthase/poly-beta-1,6-N-acetylglucosamine synthase-like glycosyltransferase
LIIEVFQGFFLFFSILIVVSLIRHYIFTFSVLRQLRKPQKQVALQGTSFEPTVSILIPAHNEEKVIGQLIQCIVELTYPQNKLQVIVIDDASSDKTGEIAESYSKKYSYINTLHREPKSGGRGKASALNFGLKYAIGEIVLCFDSDYLPQGNFVEKLVKEFVNPTVGAVQGRPVVMNEPKNMVTRLVALERIGGYRVDQEARNVLGLVPQFGGTAGGFRRSLIESLGGFDETMLTEDTDLTFQIYLEGFNVSYAGDAECYEEAVDSWKSYWRQRHRWARGHMEVCFKHAFKVLKSKKLNSKQKIDGLLLLHIYFMPIITSIAFLIGATLIFLGRSQFVDILWLSLPLSFYSFVGNFAPFFEVGIGAYLDGRTRIQWLAPLLIFAFLYNLLICTKAFFDLLISKILRKKGSRWSKTEHKGNGNRYI